MSRVDLVEAIRLVLLHGPREGIFRPTGAWETRMRRSLELILSAALVGLVSASPPATAAVTYAFFAGAGSGPTSVTFQFVVTTPEFITGFAQLSPTTASCAVTSPTFESCSIGSEISFAPRLIGVNPSIGFSALLKPINSDFFISQGFGASFGVPPGAAIFDTPGFYTATSLSGLLVATLQVSEIAGPPPPPIPEPSTWLLLAGGLGLAGAAARRRRLR
ncbi:MAG: PEP-CTERM sorting domain-containing protein [Caldimonas sp.]